MDRALEHATRLSVPPNVLWSHIANEAVLLDTEAGRYYGLDEVGAFIFGGVREDLALGEIHDRLVRTFAADAAVLWADLETFVTELVRLKLVAVK